MKNLILVTCVIAITTISNNVYSQSTITKEQTRRNLENSDYVEIGKAIKLEFENWAVKGEFEKTLDYQNRISKESSEQFATICLKEITKKTDPYSISNQNEYNRWLYIKLKRYDADKELYYISLSKEYSGGIELVGVLKILPMDAQELKENFEDYKQIVEAKDWFFSNHNLFPSKIKLSKTKEYIITYNLSNKNNIIYSPSGLNINIPNSLNISPFNYTLQAPKFIENLRRQELDEERESDDNAVYSFVSMENPPSHPGGIEKFYKFIEDNKKYPTSAIENNIQGNVFVSFTVEKDGSLTDIKVDRKLGHGTDEEAVRVLKLSKRWNPGMQNGKPVRVKYNIPVKFSLPQ